jgi:hypothetical protein
MNLLIFLYSYRLYVRLSIIEDRVLIEDVNDGIDVNLLTLTDGINSTLVFWLVGEDDVGKGVFFTYMKYDDVNIMIVIQMIIVYIPLFY